MIVSLDDASELQLCCFCILSESQLTDRQMLNVLLKWDFFCCKIAAAELFKSSVTEDAARGFCAQYISTTNISSCLAVAICIAAYSGFPLRGTVVAAPLPSGLATLPSVP